MSKEEEMKNILNDLDASFSQIRKDIVIEYQQKFNSFQSLLEEFDTCNPTKEQWDEFDEIVEKYFVATKIILRHMPSKTNLLTTF